MTIVFNPEAEASEYYRQISETLRHQLLDDIVDAARRIEELPHAWPPIAGDLRRCLCSKFPYALIYKVAGENIKVYALAHLKRKPDYWRKRLEK